MEPSTNSRAASSRPTKVKDTRRRVWSEREEKELINALKEIITIGWKCENGFRVGYLTTLEKLMLKVFPDTDLRADPHINSKIHVWKKNYGSISTMLSRSGFGWNDVKNEIAVESDDVWDTYLKTDPSAKFLRRKSFPYFKDWCEIFGKDRATGENALDFNDIAAEEEEPYIPSFGVDAAHVWEAYTEAADATQAEVGDSSVPKNADSMSTTNKKGKGKKRKHTAQTDNEILSLMGSFCNEATTRLGDIATKMGYEFALSNKRGEVYAALTGLGCLNMKDKIFVCKKLVNNRADMDMFFSLPDEDKIELVRMILGGQLP